MQRDVASYVSTLVAAEACGFEFVAVLPLWQLWQICGLPSQGKSEAGHDGIAAEVHVWTQLVAGLVIVVLGVVLGLFHAPLVRVSLIFHALIDGKSRHTHARHA